MASSRLAATAPEAVAAWTAINAPVAMKIVSPNILHKTEIGGVRLGLTCAVDVATAFEDIMAACRQHHPDARLEGILVAEMISGGVETVLGVTNDPVLGPAVMFGLGGVFVEVLGDVTFRLAPFGRDEAYRMINEIKGIKMLHGARGSAPADIDTLADALVNLSVFAADNADRISSIDINPFIVLEKGAAAVDALIVPAGNSANE